MRSRFAFVLSLLAVILPLTVASTASAAAFTAGNVVVVRVGDGAAALPANGTAAFLDEYTPAGSLVQSIAMPTTTVGSNRRFVLSGTATTEGLMTRSVDGQYLVVPGYDAAPGTASLTTSTSATVNRVIARIGINGTVDTTTALTDAISAGNPRSAASTNGTDLWISGTSGGGGVRYAAYGATTSTSLAATPTNLRALGIFNSQLYVSSQSGAFRLATVGTGTPTTSGQTITNLPGFPTATGSPYGFFFADLNAGVAGVDTVWVADDGGTIGKYSLVAGSWTLNGTITASGVRGLTGSVSGTTVTLFATSTSTMFTVADTAGYNAAPSSTTATSIATAGTNRAFRGVAFAPAVAGPVDTTAPSISSASVPTAGTYVAGQNLNFTVTYDEVVIVAGGTPFLAVTLDTGVVSAAYASGSGTNTLTFTYPIVHGVSDADGIVVANAIMLNSATIKDAAGNNAATTSIPFDTTSGVLIDNDDAPSIAPPSDPIATVARDAAPFTVGLTGSDDGGVYNWSATAGAGVSSVVVSAGQGTASVTYTVTLTAGYSGTATFTATLSDNVNTAVTQNVNINVVAPPAQPSGVSAFAGTGHVALQWTAVSGATSYNVQRSTVSGSGYTTIASPATNSYDDTGVTNGTPYFYVITAVNLGGESVASTEVAATPLAAPSNVVATPGNAHVQLNWDAVAGATGYNVRRSTTSGSGYTSVATPASNSYDDTSVANGTTYYYVITATNANGESIASTQVSGTPALPGKIVISQVYGGAGCGTVGCSTYKNDFIELFNSGGTAVSVNGWSVQYAAATGTAWQVTNLPNVSIQPGQYFLIAQGAGANGVNNLPTPDATGTVAMSATAAKISLVSSTVALSGACPATVVIDRVGYGATANCTETAPAPAPSTTTSILRALAGCTDTDNNSSDFATGAPNPRNTATTLHNCSGPVTNVSPTINAPANPAATVTQGAAPFTVSLSGSDDNSIYNWSATPGTGVSSVVVSAGQGTANVTYTVTLQAGFSGTATFTANLTDNVTVPASQQVNITVTPAGPAATPTGVNATAGNAHVLLTWNAVSGATSYNVKRATVSGGPYTTIASPTTNAYDDTTAVNGTTYYYVVSAVGIGGEGNNSTEVSATPQPAPEAPTNLVATAGNAHVMLTWTASAGATSYNVKRSTVSGGPYTTIASPVTNSYDDTTAVNGTTYYYVVSAVNGNGEGSNSAQASATPVAAPTAPQNLVATPGSGSIALTWNAVSGATSYKVKRSTTNGSGYVTIASNVATNSYNDTTVVTGTTYYYVVSAVNGSGESPDSAQASAAPNVAANQIGVVISQIFPGGGTAYSNDYVELFNTSSVDRNIGGYSIQYGSATGQFASSLGNIYVIPADTIIGAGKYLSIKFGTAGSGAATNTDITGPTTGNGAINMSGASGKVAFATVGVTLNCGATATPCTYPDSRIVDVVSYGVSNNGEGGTTVKNGVALNGAEGAMRNEEGCRDTNNNNLDFTVVSLASTPMLAPRTSATPAHICPPPNLPPTITAPSNPAATVNENAAPFTLSLTGSDDNSVYNWSVTAGTGIQSVVITSGQNTNNVTFTVTLQTNFYGTASFTATLTDGYNTPVTQVVNIQVNRDLALNHVPTITAPANPAAYVAKNGGPVTVNLTGSDDNNIYTWSATPGAGVSSVIITAGQGTPNVTYSVTITPEFLGTATFTASLSDGVNPATNQVVNIGVSPSGSTVPHVVISQVYGGGGNANATFTHDYVEIYNPTGSAVNLTGWSLQYSAATTTGTWGSIAPLGAIIDPGEYFLVQLASNDTAVGAPLPYPGTLQGDINMSATNGRIALVRNTEALSGACAAVLADVDLVDFVGYGTANCAEGGAAAPAIDSTHALVRDNNGNDDTNNNFNDFTSVTPPSPHQPEVPQEVGPFVVTTEPAANDTIAPRDANIVVVFNESVDVTGNWYNITCVTSGNHNSATVQRSGTRGWAIVPNVNFTPGEQCTATIFAAFVTDTDTDDSLPGTDALASNYSWSFTIATGTAPPYPPSVHLTMGNPSDAATDLLMPNNYLMEKPEIALSYNRDKGVPNWVSWHLADEWIGALVRNDTFRADPQVPAEWYRVLGSDYTGSGFDRGHMTPNADRDKETSVPINQATFLMTNMLPQAPDNNQGPWAAMENDLRTIVSGGKELYIVSGGAGSGGSGSNGGTTTTIAGGHVAVPSSTWKVVMVLDKASGDDVARVTATTRTIAVIMPNVQGIRNDPWTNYITTVDAVEALTGYDFFENVPDAIENSIEARTDSPSATNPPGAANQSVSTNEDVQKSFTLVTANPSGNTLTYTILTGPSNGTLGGTDGNRTYTPAPNFNGSDSFTYRVNDGSQNSNIATVTITVLEVNDAPIPASDAKVTTINTPVTFNSSELTPNDAAGPANENAQTLTVTGVTGTVDTHGTVSLTDGLITYSPDTGYTGPASFSYTVCDNGVTAGLADPLCATGTVNVTVNAAPAPVTTHFSVSAPSFVATGVAFNVTVTAQDASNSVVTSFTGPVHFSSSDATATLPADYTFVAGDNGTKTFSVTINSDGTFTITVTSQVNEQITGATQVTAGTPSPAPASINPYVGSPQSTPVNTTFPTQLQAQVLDGNNQPVSGVSVTFTAPASGASGTFASSATVQTNASGLAFAPAFTANNIVGTYYVTATVGALTANFVMQNTAGAPASITAIAGTPQSATINTMFGTMLQAKVVDAGNNPVSGATVTFSAPASGASGTFDGMTSVLTDANGIATAPAFTANSIAGSYNVTATVGALTTTFALTNSATAPASITPTAGTPQSTTINTQFATALKVRVADAGNNPLSGISVTFTAPASGASGTFASNATVVTDANGIATAPAFTANGTAGSYNVTATTGALTATFALTNTAGAPATMTATAGTPQSAAINTQFATAFKVRVADAGNNPLSGISVTFTAPASGASGTFASSATVLTDANGIATAPAFTANGTSGSYNVTATAGALTATFALTNTAGAPATITATAGTPQSATVNTQFATAMQVRVADAGNNPLSGVSVTFTAPASGASGTFGGTATVVTNASGIATAPAFTANGIAGSYNVTATAGALTATFALTNGALPVTHFSVSTPATVTNGTPFNVTVTALNASNGVVTGYTGTVHFTSDMGGTTLPADYTFVAGDNGTHTFSVTPNTTVGGHTITVTDTGNGSINGSATFNVLAPSCSAAPAPTPGVNMSGSVCPNSIGNNASVPAEPNVTTWTWEITNGSITSGQGTNAITFTAGSNSGVTLLAKGSNANGCIIAQRTGSATLRAVPTANITIGEQHICAGSSVIIPVTLTGTGPFTVVWSDGFTQRDIANRQTTRTVTTTTTRALRIVSVTDASCASGTASRTINIIVDPVPNITIQPQSKSLQPGQRAQLFVVAAGENMTYRWFEGAVGDESHEVGTGSEFESLPLGRSTRFWVKVSNGCGSVSSEVAIITLPTGGRRRAASH